MKVDRFVKFVVLLNCLVPVILLGWDAWEGQLGANPVNFALHTTGILALLFLLLSLAVTPALQLSGWGWLGQFRRMLGLCAFFHAVLHFFVFYLFDRASSLGDTISEIFLRPYLMVGTVGLVLMAPLAATSTNGMIKRLGPARWKALHRLAYVAATAGVLHYYMLVKADVSQPLAFAVVLGVLLLHRVAAHYRQLRADAWKYRLAPALPTPARPKSWAGQLKVTQVFDETPEVRTFRLAAAAGPRLAFDFLPGQFLNLTLVIDGKKVRRSYTIASSPTRIGYCELTIKRESQGLSSRHFHDVIKAGELIEVRAPAGRFTFTGSEADSVAMIAGGVGITPLMAQIRYLTDISWPGEIYLVYSVKTERDIVFRDELDALGRRHSNLHVTVTLTREQGSAWTGERGRINPASLARIVPKIETRLVFVCGPTEMTDPTRQMLRDLGVPEAAIRVESFVSPSRATAVPMATADAIVAPSFEVGEAEDATVTFARSMKSAPVLTGQTVLEIAEALAVPINYDCRAGFCGQCKTKLLSGRVVMEVEDALTAQERANRMILSCQARCLDQVVVDA